MLREKRQIPRQRPLKGAVIAFNNRYSTMDCVVANLTRNGAMLKVSSTIGIPERFELKLEHEEFRWCRVRLRQRDKMGVAFE